MSSYRGYGTLSAHQKPTVGDTKMSVASIDHMGWLLCDGRSLNVKDFFFLFSMIQYSFGGSGGVFNLPNPAGRVAGVIGQARIDDVSGANHPLGDTVGEEEHVLTLDEMAQHDHRTGQYNTGLNINYEEADPSYTQPALTDQTLTDNGHTHTGKTVQTADEPESESVSGITTAPQDQVSGSNDRQLTLDIDSNTTGITLNDPTHTHKIVLRSSGNDVAHNTMQPTLFMGNMFIYSGKPNFGTVPYSLSYPYMPVTPTTTATPYSSRTLIL